MRKFKWIGIIMLATILMATQAFATTMYSDLSTWQAAVGTSAATVDQSSWVDGTYKSVLPLVGGGSIALSASLEVYTANGSWMTWPNDYNGHVLFSGDALKVVTGTFSSPVAGFGLWMEPNNLKVFSMTMALSDGNSLTQDVDGNYGAKFFGWAGWDGGTSQIMTLSILDGQSDSYGFAFTVSPSDQKMPSVPLPASLLLLGPGLAGLAILRKRFTK